MTKLRIEIEGDHGLPTWAIMKYLQDLSLIYLKIATIQKVCELKIDGIADSSFLVASNSVPVYSKPFDLEDFHSFVELASKYSNPSRFWDLIYKCERPAVFVVKNGAKIALYDFNSQSAFRIKNFSENSPFRVIVEGLGSVLKEIFFNGRRRNLEEELLKRKINTEEAKTICEIVKTGQIINDPRIPHGIRIYAMATLEKLIKKSATHDEKIESKLIKMDIVR